MWVSIRDYEVKRDSQTNYDEFENIWGDEVLDGELILLGKFKNLTYVKEYFNYLRVASELGK